MRTCLLHAVAFCLFLIVNIFPAAAADGSIEGKWDMTIIIDGKPAPSWLEVRHSGTKRLVGQYVGVGGSARPIAKVTFEGNKMSFAIPPQWEEENTDMVFEAVLEGDSLVGTVVAANGEKYNWTARRAPLLKRTGTPSWGKSIQLFNGKDMNHWTALGENQWVVADGALKSPHSGANLVTKQKFTDFKLHIEFRCPKGSNSGVYLRGRYEVQIEDSHGKEPTSELFGGVYGFLTPNEMAAKTADQWQSYDITFVGRLVTVVANGKEIICRAPIPGITGGALDSHEGESGPILLQGDHGPIEYRNITITPAK